MVESMASEDEKQKYYQYLYRSYIECSRSRKWCPAPGCEFAVEFKDAAGCESYDVTCDCDYKFCWKCMQESHRPVDCKTVEKWIKKNSSEDEGSTYEESRERAKNVLARYTHYYERWDSNDKSRKRALSDLNQARNQHIDKLAGTQGESLAVHGTRLVQACAEMVIRGYGTEKPGKLEFFGYLGRRRLPWRDFTIVQRRR
ncbi:putative E3 ubiquitin-protein ligase ARI7 [Sesamum angolense]|uniref:RBR-type E3 ubiquitin transferase n=1 Tax=Sesamum angolense TaxID=2727404 RepID=A0AAE1TA45_9LAMI|nr:putative E3 ubiquitin-protein ligase ARI7 [Sesamum angolense]